MFLFVVVFAEVMYNFCSLFIQQWKLFEVANILWRSERFQNYQWRSIQGKLRLYCLIIVPQASLHASSIIVLPTSLAEGSKPFKAVVVGL